MSVSIEEELLEELDNAQRKQGYSGRSDIVRSALRLLLNDLKKSENLTGKIEGVMMIVHKDNHSEEISKVKHEFLDIVKTQIHNHLDNHKCLELFVLCGDSERVKDLKNRFETNKGTEFVKLIVS